MRISTAIRKLKRYYEQAKTWSWVEDPVAYALYRTWRDADEERIRKRKEVGQ